MKVFLLITAILDLKYKQFDMIIAFLNALLDKEDEIYIAQPNGFDDGIRRAYWLL